MAALAWVMMGLALWHFTIFLPDHFWGGIVGAFVAAIIGALLSGLLLNGLSIPARDDTTVATVMQAVPGTLLVMAACYLEGTRREAPE